MSDMFATIWIIYHCLFAVLIYVTMPSPHVLRMRKRGRKFRAEAIFLIVSLMWEVYLVAYLWNASRKVNNSDSEPRLWSVSPDMSTCTLSIDGDHFEYTRVIADVATVPINPENYHIAILEAHRLGVFGDDDRACYADLISACGEKGDPVNVTLGGRYEYVKDQQHKTGE